MEMIKMSISNERKQSKTSHKYSEPNITPNFQLATKDGIKLDATKFEDDNGSEDFAMTENSMSMAKPADDEKDLAKGPRMGQE